MTILQKISTKLTRFRKIHWKIQQLFRYLLLKNNCNWFISAEIRDAIAKKLRKKFMGDIGKFLKNKFNVEKLIKGSFCKKLI